jgi:DNA-binding transcriptional LysR family regulator
VQSYLLAIELVASSNLLTTLPKALVAPRQRNLLLVDPPVTLDHFTLVAAWHPRVASDPAHRWLRQQLFDLRTSTEDVPS